MTSGVFHSYLLSDIYIPRSERQRRTIDSKHIESLADSLRRNGLIHPVVITREGQLVAGECRTLAARSIGWSHISVQFQDELDEETLVSIELEENIKRKDIEWQERTAAINKLHNMRLAKNPEWTHADTASSIGLSRNRVTEHLTVASRMDDPDIGKADSFVKALTRANNKNEREVIDSIHMGRTPTHTHLSPVQVTDFIAWAPTYSGTKFNLIHCDFPYGIDAHKHKGQNSRLQADYDDDEETYWRLVRTLIGTLDNFCSPSAHMIFWFSPKTYSVTQEALKQLDDFVFDPYPLIWIRGDGDTPNSGIAPVPYKRPRLIYEMAFFGTRGDRTIIHTKANAFVAPPLREYHPHEKSEAALRHWFEMCVDGNTRLFDPTCGSGSALRAALSLGASSVLGLELNEEYAKDARIALGTSSGDLRYA